MDGQSFLSPQSPLHRIAHISVGDYAHKPSLSCPWLNLFCILRDKLIFKEICRRAFSFPTGKAMSM